MKNLVTRSKTGIGTALTQTTVAKDNLTITIPAEKGGRLIAVEAEAWGILETVVNTGGLVVLHNSSEHWEPFEFFIGPQTVVGSGAIARSPFRLVCNKPLPGNSTVTADYTPQDNQSQQLTLTLFWELGGRESGGSQTYAKSVTGGAVTSTGRGLAITVAIPGGHSGQLKAIQTVVFGTLETVVNTGGKVEVENDSIDIKPTEFYCGLATAVTSGGVAPQPYVMPNENPCPENSTYSLYYTPYDDQSQKLCASLIWEA